jgi:hypothetical protein
VVSTVRLAGNRVVPVEGEGELMCVGDGEEEEEEEGIS